MSPFFGMFHAITRRGKMINEFECANRSFRPRSRVMRTLIAQEGLSQRCEEKLEVFKTLKVFHIMNTPPKGPLGKIQCLRLVGAIEKSEANAV
jgi:hypothetical protein